MQRHPPTNDESDLYEYSKGDPQRAHIIAMAYRAGDVRCGSKRAALDNAVLRPRRCFHFGTCTIRLELTAQRKKRLAVERIAEIRTAAEEYGRRSVENMRLGQTLGREIMAAFDKYLSPSGGLVMGVPPTGEWRTNTGDYHDAAFSFYHTPILTVRETQFGMSIQIFEHLWVRQVVILRKEGDQVAVFVDDGEAIWIPVSYKPSDLEQICERVFQSVLGIYRGNVNVFVHGDDRLMTIGFAPQGKGRE